jgi:hypothetical protein
MAKFLYLFYSLRRPANSSKNLRGHLDARDYFSELLKQLFKWSNFSAETSSRSIKISI